MTGIHELLQDLRKGKRIVDIAEETGWTKQFVSNRLRAQEMYVRTASRLLRSFGYKIVVVPEGTKVRENWFEIE